MLSIKKWAKKFRKQVPVYIPILKSELLQGRTALITGGTRGLGFAIADAFLKAGAKVIITGREETSLMVARQKLVNSTGVNESFIQTAVLDLMRIEDIGTVFAQISQKNRIDILVNNAGVSNRMKFGEMSEEEYDTVMDTNLKGVYFISQTVSNYMLSSGIEGNILNISSSSGLRPATLPYTLFKWGIGAFTEGLAKKLIGYGIVVNAIAPGQAATTMINNEEDINNPRAPLNRLVTPVEVANMAVILVSDLARTIVGDTIYMTGGSGLLTLDDIDY